MRNTMSDLALQYSGNISGIMSGRKGHMLISASVHLFGHISCALDYLFMGGSDGLCDSSPLQLEQASKGTSYLFSKSAELAAWA